MSGSRQVKGLIKLNREAGSVTLLMAAGLLFAIGVLGLMIDTGHLYLSQLDLERSGAQCALVLSLHPELSDADATASAQIFIEATQGQTLSGMTRTPAESSCTVQQAAWVPWLLNILGATNLTWGVRVDAATASPLGAHRLIGMAAPW